MSDTFFILLRGVSPYWSYWDGARWHTVGDGFDLGQGLGIVKRFPISELERALAAVSFGQTGFLVDEVGLDLERNTVRAVALPLHSRGNYIDPSLTELGRALPPRETPDMVVARHRPQK